MARDSQSELTHRGTRTNSLTIDPSLMPTHNLDKISAPHRIAVFGASDKRSSVGYSVLRNLIGTEFDGVVCPVNNKREAVQGIQAYPNVDALPHVPDLVIVCTPAASVPYLVHECGRAGVGGG